MNSRILCPIHLAKHLSHHYSDHKKIIIIKNEVLRIRTKINKAYINYPLENIVLHNKSLVNKIPND